jgi:hypothetical protein
MCKMGNESSTIASSKKAPSDVKRKIRSKSDPRVRSRYSNGTARRNLAERKVSIRKSACDENGAEPIWKLRRDEQPDGDNSVPMSSEAVQ